MNAILQQILGQVEVAAKTLAVKELTPELDALLKQLEAKIPGNIDDVLIESVKPQIEQAILVGVMGILDKIDGIIGDNVVTA